MAEYKKSDILEALATEVIGENMDRFGFIVENNISIGYQYSTGEKKSSGRIVFADTEKVKSKYGPFMPYHFIITFYEPSTLDLDWEMKKRIMYHELLHVGYDPETEKFSINPHNLEDFRECVELWGVDWVQ